jgi:hypothetical protein
MIDVNKRCTQEMTGSFNGGSKEILDSKIKRNLAENSTRADGCRARRKNELTASISNVRKAGILTDR